MPTTIPSISTPLAPPNRLGYPVPTPEEFFTSAENWNDSLFDTVFPETNQAIQAMNTQAQEVTVLATNAYNILNSATSVANFQGVYVSGATATVGQSWLFQGNIYLVLVNTTQDPLEIPASWIIINGYVSKSFGNLSHPILDLDLTNSINFKAGIGSATFSRAGIGTYLDIYGFRKTASIDEIRFEKNGYLVEVPSTNVLTYSSDMSTGWVATRVTKSTDGTKGADGITDMVKLTEDSTLAISHVIYQTYTWSLGVWTASIDFLAGSTNRGIRLTLNGAAFKDLDYVNIDENYVISKGSTAIQARIKEYHANGGVRVEITGECDVATSVAVAVNMIDTTTGLITYDGDGTSFIYVQFPQVEALAFATSYIPTTTTAATRSADNLSLDFLYNMLNWKDVSSIVIDYDTLGKTHTANRFLLKTGATANGFANIGVVGNITYSTANTANTAVNLFDSSQKLNRAVFTNDGTTLLSYIDGVLQADTGTNGTGAETNTAIYIGTGHTGTDQLAGHIKRVRIYGRTLTPEEARLA